MISFALHKFYFNLKDIFSVIIHFPVGDLVDHQKSVRHLRKIEKSHGFKVSDDFYTENNYQNAFQFFSEEGKMIFQSYRIFDQLSYSIADIVNYPWHELFEREDYEEQKIMETTRITLLTGRSMKFHCCPHVVRERMSVSKNTTKIQLLKCYPVFNQHSVAIGYIATMLLNDTKSIN